MNDDMFSDFEDDENVVWHLCLFIAGRTTKSIEAISNLKKMCEQHLNGRYDIEIIDLLEQPEYGEIDQIVAIPTLIRRLPLPVRKIIGDLSNKEKVLIGLEIKPLTKDN